MVESTETKSIKVSPERPIRLSKRLYKDMSPEDQVTYVVNRVEKFESKTQVQVAFNYWCDLWERHYGRPYYDNNAKIGGTGVSFNGSKGALESQKRMAELRKKRYEKKMRAAAKKPKPRGQKATTEQKPGGMQQRRYRRGKNKKTTG